MSAPGQKPTLQCVRRMSASTPKIGQHLADRGSDRRADCQTGGYLDADRSPVRAPDPRPAPAIAAGAPGAVMEEPQHARRVEAEADPLLRTGDQLG